MPAIDDSNGRDRRQGEVANWRKLDKRLDEIDERLGAIEKTVNDTSTRRRHVREFFEDFGRWTIYGGKVIVSLGVIGGAIVALVAWIASNGQ